MTAPEWRECADPVELAAAVAAGVEVLLSTTASPRWPSTSVTADQFRHNINNGVRYRVPSSWSCTSEPVCRRCHNVGYIDTSAGAVACDCVEPPAPDDLVSQCSRDNATTETTPPPRGDAICVQCGGGCVVETILGPVPCDDCTGGYVAAPGPPAPDYHLTIKDTEALQDRAVDAFMERASAASTPAPDDLVSRARRYAETHPESRELIEELLEELLEAVVRWACFAAPPPVPPWPGAVLSGCVDEDGVPTWLAQAGDVRGEMVRACTSVPWLPNTSYGEDEWVEVRAPRAAAATERVQAWEAVRDGRQVVGASSPFEAHYIWRGSPGRAFIGERTMDKAVLVAPDGTVEVLKDGDQ